MDNRVVVVTGANRGIGLEITRALAREGMAIVMACRDVDSAVGVCEQLKKETGNRQIRIAPLNLASFDSIHQFMLTLQEKNVEVRVLINNAGIMNCQYEQTENGLEKTVGVNYVGPYLLTRLLLPLMKRGARIINIVSCTYKIGKIGCDFFTKGHKGNFYRIPVYAASKLALLLFTRELAEQVKERGITVNAADPGIVNTRMITMGKWFDPLADFFFRPFIRTTEQGAATAVYLALKEDVAGISGSCFVNCKQVKLPVKITNAALQKQLWSDTEGRVKSYL